MKKSFIKFVVSFILGVFVVGAVMADRIEAKPCPYCYHGVTVHVSDAKSFYDAVNNACEDTVIELDNDIYLDAPVNTGVLGIIRKNGHKVVQVYTIQHPGYYTSEPVVTYQNVWHDGWTETVYCEVFC